MGALTKNTKSYQFVKWGTAAALVLLTILLVIVVATEWVESSFFSVAYLFFVIISAVRHRGNLFILPKGIILNGKFYSSNQLKSYEIEKIVRWHSLYGLNSRVNNAYKLSINRKKKQFQPEFIVVENLVHLEQITALLNQQGIQGIQKVDLV
ncbi:hypothetical protein [Neobacillus soli]|uniref:hypothetical protein n=1 Tax=Neobacillus soli TaxID=220688 RepID=UPI000AE0D723|nr:hypothetical protein [Neobacillus soli]